MKRLILLAFCAALLFVLNAAFWRAPNPPLLPEAQNDFIIAAIGFDPPVEPESAASETALPPASDTGFPAGAEPVTSIEAKPLAESYPVGTSEVLLEVKNNGDSALGYTLWFDIRRVEGDALAALAVSEYSIPDFDALESFRLEAGESVQIPVQIDLFEEPLPAGVYRAAQLACFEDAHGNALACTEIAAEFTLL